MRKFLQRRSFQLCLIICPTLCGAYSDAFASQHNKWWSSADRVFREVVHNSELPDALIPAAMAQDSSGFIWMGGDNGLLRWDGYQFRKLEQDPEFPEALTSAVSTLHQDKRGQLWAGTAASGLARVGADRNRLACVRLSGDHCGVEHVWSIDDDGANGLWIGTNLGLFRLDANGQVIRHWAHLPGSDNSSSEIQVFAVLSDHNGALWVGTNHGLLRTINEKDFQAVRPVDGPLRAVSHLMEDSEGRIWVGTRQNGAYIISSERGPPRRVLVDGGPSDKADISSEITSMLEVLPDRIWLGTYGHGIIEVNGSTLQAQRIVHNPFVPSGLNGSIIMSIYRDKSGITWVGTEEGVSQYNYNPTGLLTFSDVAGVQSGSTGGSVMAAIASPDGNLWTGLQEGGFAIIQLNGRRIAGLPQLSVFTMALAPAGGVLLGTNGGLFLVDWSGSRVKRLNVPNLLPTADIRALTTLNGVVWLGARDDGLRELSVDENGGVKLIRYETSSRLSGSTVEVIASAPDGLIAVGTYGGLDLLDPRSGLIKHILSEPKNPFGLASAFVTCFVTDRFGKLWVGTSAGLARLDRWVSGRPQFRRFGGVDGLPNSSIDSLVIDQQGIVWASTDMGLVSIDPETLSITAISRYDGLAVTNYWDNSATVLTSGELVFGGLGGLSMIDPQAVKRWLFKPPVVFTTIQVGRGIAQTQPYGPTGLYVSPHENALAVEFAALDYSAPAQNRYAYFLEGFDASWHKVDAAHRTASYTNLPPGQYTLRVRGTNREGVWSQPELTVAIHVLHAWYQTLCFRIMAGLAGAAALLITFRSYTALLRRRQRYLERQVEDRTAALSLSQLTLQSANADLEHRVLERTHDLTLSEARFRAWFDHADDAVFVIGVRTEGHYIFEAVNPAVERVSGIAVAAYKGRQPAEVLPSQVADVLLARYRESVTGGLVRFEATMAFPRGERIIDVWIRPVEVTADDGVQRLVSVLRDVTERRQAEARLSQAEKLQALGSLAGGIAHDFNNILQVVGGAAALIERLTNDDSKVRVLTRRAISATERGASITSRLLAFARSDTLKTGPVQTEEVLSSVCDILQDALGSAILIERKFYSGLPSLLADRSQLQTALINLGTNARDAMSGSGMMTIAAEAVYVASELVQPAALAPGSYVRISVTDTGCGMTAETTRRAIEPFFTTKAQGQGTGLGLGLVRGFSEQSGGAMELRSSLGQGTTVSIWLRQAEANVKPDPMSSGSSAIPFGALKRVLIVDDEIAVRETVEDLLANAGFLVSSAVCGADALLQIKSGNIYDILLCDLTMPGINGIETIKKAQEILPNMLSFLFTGDAGERQAKADRNGYTLLRKPISVGDLIAELNRQVITETAA